MDEIHAYEKIIKANIEYDILIINNPFEKDRIDEIVELMTETVCTSREYLTIAGDNFPAELVKSKLLKLNSEHIDYVLNSIKNNTTQVRNIKKYILAALFMMIANSLEKACGQMINMVSAFTDVAGHWAEQAINKLITCGIVNGFVDKTFKPDQPITRGQAAIMAANMLYYCGVKGMDYATPFPDTAGHYADSHIQTLQHYGVVNGYEDGLFRPDEEITRGQAAMYVANCLTVVGKQVII